MNYKICITKQGDKFIAGNNCEGAYHASGDTPLQALSKWIHAVGIGIVKYQNGEITLERLARRIGVSEAEAQEIAEIETLTTAVLNNVPA